ncbi:hypothetical protein [Ekhidna sp.]|uniref:phosphoribosyltransferase-like protein n=1 Tax=Ekhidna sp. TaxID=2608089 RepID=UPI003298F951
MDELIEDILETIGGYREEDVNWAFKGMSAERVKNWINQFDEEDREFLLNELKHILPKSYLSKEDTLETFGGEFEVLRKDFGYETVNDFLDETRFLDCQEELKSQKVLLGLIDEVLFEKYGYRIKDCGKKEIKNWLYIDDVLASGKTFKDDIIEEIQKYGNEEFKESRIRIIASFFILHTWAVVNVPYAIAQSVGVELEKEKRISFYRVSEIENNPRINAYNPSPKFNHVYPLKGQEGEEFLDFIEAAFDRQYPMGQEQFAFRDPNYPKEEKFYSSKENRIRYENILLNKGIEIIKSIDELRARGIRPLGMAPSSYKTLGTGSHFFTWRNISNTCPLVFWWGANDWQPLFPVKNRGNG